MQATQTKQSFSKLIAFRVAFGVELKKLFKSKVFWILLGFFIFLPLMMGLLMLLVKNPELASKMGIVSTSKAQMIGTADWATYFSFLGQLVSISCIKTPLCMMPMRVAILEISPRM